MQTAQQRQSTPITSFLFGLVLLAMLIAFSLLIANQFGYSFSGAAQQPAPVLPPTAIIRVVAPAAPAAQPAPMQAAPAPIVAPEPAQPAVAAPVEAAPEPAAPARQIIIIKNGADPGSAPVVIDRGTKRRSP